MSGRYRTIVADPPWPIEWSGGGPMRVNGRGERHVNHKFNADLPYGRMSIEDICALPVSDLAEADAHLYLWIPDEFLVEGDGARVARAWGFQTGRIVVGEYDDETDAAALLWWRKRGYGLGRFPRPQHEALVVCRRGALPFSDEVRDVGSVQEWKFPYENGARAHSRKPDGSIDLIERASPGPYLELFARRARFGWDYWGDESLQTAVMGA
jgi:N6-adenosine-specific RNA methylase IME4